MYHANNFLSNNFYGLIYSVRQNNAILPEFALKSCNISGVPTATRWLEAESAFRVGQCYDLGKQKRKNRLLLEFR